MLKITRADAVHKAKIFQRLSAGTTQHGHKHILQLLDNFQIHGPNGTHEALVTDILVPMQYLHDLRIFDAKQTSYESILALAYLNQCRIIHGGMFLFLPFLGDPLIHLFPRSTHGQYSVFSSRTNWDKHASLDGAFRRS